MAENKTVKLNVESNVDEVTAGFEKTGSAINTATKDVKNFNKETTKGTDEIVDGQKKIQKSFKKTGTEVKKAGDSFKKFKGAGDGVKSGFETAEGAMALFGAESEALEEKMQTLGEVMNLSQSVKGLKEGAGVFKAFGKSAITALQGMGKAVIATGIGALVVGVALLVTYWEDITALMGGAEAEGQKILDQSIEQAELQEEKYNASVKYEDILRAQGKSEKFIRDLQMEELNLAIEKAKVAVENAKQQKKLSLEAVKFNQKVLDGVLKVILFPLDMIVRTYNKIAKYVPGLSPMGLLSSSIAKAVFNVEDASAEADQKIKDAEKSLKDLELQKAKIVLKDKAEASSRYKEKKKKEKEAQDKLEKQQKEHEQRLIDQYNDYLKAIEDADEKEYQRKLTDQGRDEDAVRNYYGNLKGQAEHHLANLKETDENYLEQKKLIEDQILNLERQQKEELAEIEKKYQDEATANELSNAKELQDLKYFLMAEGVEKEKLLLEESYKEKFKLAENNAEMTLALEEKLAQEKKLIDRKYNEVKAQMAVKGLQLIAGIAEEFAGEDEKRQKVAFNIKKVADIASATMDGYKAVLSTYAQTPGGPVIKGISAGIAGAFSALQIASIARTKFEGGSDGGLDNVNAPSDTGAGVVSPEFNIVGDSGINDLEGLGEPAPIQAYVTSQDVTTAQGLDRARVENATI